MRGRPSKYSLELAKEIDNYLETCGSHNLKLPQVTDFARFIGISKDTIYKWADKYEDISDAIKKIKDLQEVELINNGLYSSKEVSSTMAIFLLKTNHNYIETEKRVLMGEDGGPIKVYITPGEGFVPTPGTSSSEG